MVERPIKKSERQAISESPDAAKEGAAAQTEVSVENPPTEAQPRKERIIDQPLRGRDKDKTKGKDRDKGKRGGDDRPPQVSPALMRGPKPTKPKPPVIKADSAEVDESAEDSDSAPVGESEAAEATEATES
jgi:hypothetical protein